MNTASGGGGVNILLTPVLAENAEMAENGRNCWIIGKEIWGR
jgi:hypothetical protein